jgi:nickel superoxide dismutase
MKANLLYLITLLSFVTGTSLSAHCQVPCGIFDDEAKFAEFNQHVATIGKSTRLIREIAAKDHLSALDRQQLIRWTLEKEAHAQKIISDTADYFLAQRVKPGTDHYAEKLELLHHIIVDAMKSKQSVENAPVESLAKKIAAFRILYLHLDPTH